MQRTAQSYIYSWMQNEGLHCVCNHVRLGVSMRNASMQGTAQTDIHSVYMMQYEGFNYAQYTCLIDPRAARGACVRVQECMGVCACVNVSKSCGLGQYLLRGEVSTSRMFDCVCAYVCLCLCVCVYVYMCMCVCVSERHRERQRQSEEDG